MQYRFKMFPIMAYIKLVTERLVHLCSYYFLQLILLAAFLLHLKFSVMCSDDNFDAPRAAYPEIPLIVRRASLPLRFM